MLLNEAAAGVRRTKEHVSFTGAAWNFAVLATVLTPLAKGTIDAAMQRSELRVRFEIYPKLTPLLLLTATFGFLLIV